MSHNDKKLKVLIQQMRDPKHREEALLAWANPLRVGRSVIVFDSRKEGCLEIRDEQHI